MPWYRLMYQAGVVGDLSAIGAPIAQRLLEKTKWLASNVQNLRHESPDADLPYVHKYAVGDWRIFYVIDRDAQVLDVHAIVHKQAIPQ
jgi:mRNA interferase RelE/StbE